ncbi:MAG: ATP-binding protein, partial [Verrucomicrobiota bacterium]
TKQLLGFAKGSSPKRKKQDLGQLIKRSARLATMGSNIRWDLSIASSLQSVEVDETQIVQVFSNLLINARQAMPAGGIIQIGCENVQVTPEMGLKIQPGPYVVATVRDRGTGIPEDQLSKIFEPYYTTKPEGSGLGLATCYSAVQKHEGTITVRSKIDVGTEFNIYLPAVSADVEPPVIEPPRIIPGDGSILVVDDQDGVRAVAVQILEKLGYDAISATDGEEALRLYMKRMHSGEPISAILMDMTLPGGMSGDETLREIRRLDPNVRSIATSGYFEEDAEMELRERGYKAMLPKPYTAEGLSVALQTVLTS